MINIRTILSVLLVLMVGGIVTLGGCGQEGATPTGASSLAFSSGDNFAATGGAGPDTLASNPIAVYTDASAFQAVLTTSTVKTFSQDLNQSGTALGGGTYEMNLGGVRITMEGPAYYGNLDGVVSLSKGVPVTVSFPPEAQGAGLSIAQLSEVRVTATSRNGETTVLDPFMNGGMGFLGFTSEAGIASIEFTDPDPSDTITPITNLADITFAAIGPETLPLDCAVLRERRTTVRVEVQGAEVRITVIAHGVGIPEEVNVSPIIEHSLGRFGFWPHGRHNPPKVVSELFSTTKADDFPAQVELLYRHSGVTGPTEVLANLDYEVLSACRDEMTGQIIVGGLDEYGYCRKGEQVILQCDRGVSYTIN